jgi:hypothetical protein
MARHLTLREVPRADVATETSEGRGYGTPRPASQIGEPLTGHVDAVLSATFSPDGKRNLKALFRQTGSIHAEEPVRRTPELFWEASPIVERQRPVVQARIARDRIVLIDTS